MGRLSPVTCRLISVFFVLAAGIMGACSLFPHTGRIPSPTEPFLTFSPEEIRRYENLEREHHALLLTCGRTRSCDRVHFTLALISLAESRDVASRHFEAVLSATPEGRMAVSSRAWLQVLRTTPSGIEPHGPLMYAVTTSLVREYLDREAAVLQQVKGKGAMPVASLQQELKSKDRQIQSLSRQLEALKHIDDEIREKTRPMSPTNTPLPARERMNP